MNMNSKAWIEYIKAIIALSFVLAIIFLLYNRPSSEDRFLYLQEKIVSASTITISTSEGIKTSLESRQDLVELIKRLQIQESGTPKMVADYYADIVIEDAKPIVLTFRYSMKRNKTYLTGSVENGILILTGDDFEPWQAFFARIRKK